MSSPQPFVASSPTTPGRRKKSKFTFKHLNLLAQASIHCPLRVIALADLDCFYAQCAAIRLGLPEDRPCGVQQWNGLIAINYPARSVGLNRHVTIAEAKQKCPDLVCSHVALWREGSETWAYRDEPNITTDKVSLDPFRLESRKILALIKQFLPAPPVQKVEKASIDEVFLDLSTQIHGILLERHPELRHAPYDDPTEFMPAPPNTALNWEADSLIDLDDDQTEDDDPDWDDVVMNIGSEIVRNVRKTIRENLKYTCSAGIARNKILAKLGAGYRKPNQQTIVRNRAVQRFLSGFKFTKLRGLGGKLGDQLVETFNTDEVNDLLKVPLDTLKTKLGDDTGTWLHGLIRGEEKSEVTTRTQIKSMLSAKSFRPSINSFEQGVKWLRIFIADIYARLVEEGVTENKRRPKTMNLHHRQGGQTRSKQLPIPSGKKIEKEMLLDLAKTLLQQIIVDGRSWPCSNLSLSVGGFEDGIQGNRGIGSFLIHGDEAKALEEPSRSNSATPIPEEQQPRKRRKLGGESSIGRFFKSESTVEDEQNSEDDFGEHEKDARDDNTDQHEQHNPSIDVSSPMANNTEHVEQHRDIATYFCQDCQKNIPESEREEHQDWHFAKSLQAEDREQINGPSNSRPPGVPISKPKRGGASKLRGGRGSKPEKGQSRLAF